MPPRDVTGRDYRFSEAAESSPRLQGTRHASRGGFLIVTLLMVAISLFGCEENLAPRAHYDAVPFTVYGVLSPDLDTQSVRLYVPEDFPTLGSPEPLDVDVTSTDLYTGERRAWRDTVLVDPNGQHEHVFWSPFRAAFGHAYRVEVVRRADGARSVAEVRIPEPVTVRIVNEGDPLVEVLIEGENIRALKPEAEYDVDIGDCQIVRNRFSYQGRERRVEDGWRFTLNLVVDNRNILWDCVGITQFLPTPCPPYYHRLRALNLHVLIGDAVWDPPDGVFDPHLLSQPQALSNVENGFGFIGAGYRIVAPLRPSEEALALACFIYVGGGDT